MRPLNYKLSLPITQDAEGSTPLHLAALYGHTRICEILIRETEAPDLVFMPDVQGNTPLHCAALGKNSDTLEALLMRGGLVASTNLKYLLFPLFCKYIDHIYILFDFYTYQTAFHMVSMPPPPRKLLSYAEKTSWISDAVRMCTSLLEYGADIFFYYYYFIYIFYFYFLMITRYSCRRRTRLDSLGLRTYMPTSTHPTYPSRNF